MAGNLYVGQEIVVAINDGSVRYARVCALWSDRFKFRIGRLPLNDIAKGGPQGEYEFDKEGVCWARGWASDTVAELRATANLLSFNNDDLQMD